MPFVSDGVKVLMELRKKGLEKAIKEGLEGRRECLLEVLPVGLKLKFGPAGPGLLPELEGQELLVLERVFYAIEGTDTLDDLRKLLPTSQANGA